MLIAAVNTSDVLGILGGFSLLIGAVLVAFGQRARTVAQQQDQTINALEGRLSVVESENRTLQSNNNTLSAVVVERDHRIDGLQSEVGTLRELFATGAAVEALTTEIRDTRTAILGRLPGP